MTDALYSMPGNRITRIVCDVGFPAAAVFLACFFGALMLAASGTDPSGAYASLFNGAFKGMSAIGRTMEKSMPLILNGLAVAFAFQAGLFNIGAQGQLLFGALAAAVTGYGVSGLPFVIHAPLSMMIGMLAGGLYGAVMGMLKAYTGAHEVITGIMLNYVAINLTDYFASGPMRDSSGGNIISRTPQILETSVIPSIGCMPVGFLISLAAAFFVWIMFRHTVIGFEIRTVGLNPYAAAYAGINVSHTIVLTMACSGMLAGLGGAVETQNVVYRFQPGFHAGLGFDGITIALLARTHALGVIPAAVLVGAMRAGSGQMQFTSGVSPEIIDVIQATILFFVAADSLLRWIVRINDRGGERRLLTTGWGKIE